uniref:Uncharacterized protein n=1 Tax=Photinus pyralis TaxID=7054 RepID=A0A1Y1JWQ5_PHOPY
MAVNVHMRNDRLKETIRENVETLKPFILVSKACGIPCIKLRKCTTIDYGCYFFWLSVHLILVLYNVKILREEEYPSDIPKGYWMIFLIFASLKNVTTITTALCRQKSFFAVIKGVSEVQIDLKRFNIVIDNLILKKTIRKMVMFGIILQISNAACFMLVKEVDILSPFGLVITSF